MAGLDGLDENQMSEIAREMGIELPHLRRALAEERAAQPHLATLLLKGFARPPVGDYRVTLERAAAAATAGYERIV